MADPGTGRKPSDYRGQNKATWCPGCGDYGVLTALYRAFARHDLDPARLVIVSGIGCSGRLPEFVGSYGLHGVHGRVLPTAMGVKLANPELTVIAVGGDGDGFAIGGGHVPHAVRRNVDITYVVMDNNIYSLTKGQPSPTTPQGMEAVKVSPSLPKMAPGGVHELPLNPLALVLAYGGSFVARGFASQPQQLSDLIAQGIAHRGFAFVHALSPCVTYYDTRELWRESVAPLAEEWDAGDRMRALQLALLAVPQPEVRPAYDEVVGSVHPVPEEERSQAFRTLLESFA